MQKGRAEFLTQFRSLATPEAQRRLAAPDDPGTFERCKLDFGERELHAEVYALHCDPKLEVGRLGVRVGAITAASDLVEVHLTGTGGHTARPHLTADLVYAIGKVVTGQMLQEIASLGLELQDQGGLLVGENEAAYEAKFQFMLLRSLGVRIEGGTDEILKNIIAERVLGLPGDIRVDRDVAYKDIPGGR